MTEDFDNGDGRSRRPRSSRRVNGEPEVTYEFDGDNDQSSGTGPRRRRKTRRPGANSRSYRREQDALPAPGEPLPAEFAVPFDPWRIFEALRQKWKWLALGTLGFAALSFLFGLSVINYKLKVDLIRRETSNAFRSDQAAATYLPREMSELTLIRYMMSPEVFRRASTNLAPPMDPATLRGMVKMEPGPTPDVVTITVSSRKDLERMVEVGNAVAKEAVQFTKEKQAAQADEVNRYLISRLEFMTNELSTINDKIGDLARESGFYNLEEEAKAYLGQLGKIPIDLETAKIELEGLEAKIQTLERDMTRQTPGNSRLVEARRKLAEYKAQGYTDKHPLVEGLLASIKQLEQEPAEPAAPTPTVVTGADGSTAINPTYMQLVQHQSAKTQLERQIKQYESILSNATNKVQAISSKGMELANLKSRQTALQVQYDALAKRQQETQIFVDSALGYYSPLQEANLKDVRSRMRWMKIGAMSAAGALLGLVAVVGLIMLVEAFDTRIKTAMDLEKATGLPILATLGNLDDMSESDQEKWAFRTLTTLRGKLSGTPDDGVVCGFISSTKGEGRSTWIQLLVDAAAKRGLKVLTVDTRPQAAEPEVSAVRRNRNEPVVAGNVRNGHAEGDTEDGAELKAEGGVATALATEEGDGARKPKENLAVEKTSEDGWVWSLERRKEWQHAMTQWQREDNMVLFIELPPADSEEALLLAENLPQVVWLARSGVPDGQETSKHIETLRAAGCNVVGAVLNDEAKTLFNSHFSRWFKRASSFALLSCSLLTGMAQTAAPAADGAKPGNPTLTFSASNPSKRAEWQKKLTLGPGDVLDFFVIGRPELTRTNIFIASDGTISFLHAKNVQAQGLTVDELRAKLDPLVQEFYTAARTVIQPVSYNSKKYYILGKVNSKGAYSLDRPVTLIEAVARAKGLETGLYQRNTVELADLSRSFIVRNGKKLDVDFNKLFTEGDLAHNVTIEPGDYIYFPGAAVNEIYILGEVYNPGPLGFAPNATMIAAITDRGGFTEKAYRSKVLVVRGSLTQPETFVVNVGDILYARSADFKLQPKDIVYVSRRPWAKVEELLDEAAQSFIQGSITAWTGVNVGPIIRKPILGN